jgi:HPt (histidine-containing phosphotransfer) domain-containing protein
MPSKDASRDDSIVDLQKALERADGDRVLLARLAQLFLSKIPRHLQILEQAKESGDALRFEKEAHNLRGSANIFSAFRVLQLAVALERLGHNQCWEGAEELLSSLRRELDRLVPLLEATAEL